MATRRRTESRDRRRRAACGEQDATGWGGGGKWEAMGRAAWKRMGKVKRGEGEGREDGEQKKKGKGKKRVRVGVQWSRLVE